MTWPERLILPSASHLLNLLRMVLFSPWFALIWILYVSRIAWIIFEVLAERHHFSWSNAIKAARGIKYH